MARPTTDCLHTITAPPVSSSRNFLREAGRRKGLPDVPVPAIWALVPDDELVPALEAPGIHAFGGGRRVLCPAHVTNTTARQEGTS